MKASENLLLEEFKVNLKSVDKGLRNALFHFTKTILTEMYITKAWETCLKVLFGTRLNHRRS